MGAIFRGVDTDVGRMHESTGKYPYPAGERHHPQWGALVRDPPVDFRYCEFGQGACDVIITEREYQALKVGGE